MTDNSLLPILLRWVEAYDLTPLAKDCLFIRLIFEREGERASLRGTSISRWKLDRLCLFIISIPQMTCRPHHDRDKERVKNMESSSYQFRSIFFVGRRTLDAALAPWSHSTTCFRCSLGHVASGTHGFPSQRAGRACGRSVCPEPNGWHLVLAQKRRVFYTTGHKPKGDCTQL